MTLLTGKTGILMQVQGKSHYVQLKILSMLFVHVVYVTPASSSQRTPLIYEINQLVLYRQQMTSY